MGRKARYRRDGKILSLLSGCLTDTNHKDKYIANIDEDGFSFKVISCSFQEMIRKAKKAEIFAEVWKHIILRPRMNIFGRNRNINYDNYDAQLFTIVISCDNNADSNFSFSHDRFWKALSNAAFWVKYVPLPWMIQERANATLFGELAMSALIKNR
jgi:hypothetical protein